MGRLKVWTVGHSTSSLEGIRLLLAVEIIELPVELCASRARAGKVNAFWFSATRDRRRSPADSSSDQNCAIVVDVGARRSGDHEITDAGEESVGVVVGKQSLCLQTEPQSALERFRKKHSAGVVFRAIDSVRVARNRVNVRGAGQVEGER